MHIPIINAHTHKMTVGQLGVFLGKDFVITIHAEHSAVLDELFDGCVKRTEHSEMRNSGYLLYIIIRKLLSAIEELAESVDVELDEIEGLVFNNKASDAERIGHIRQKIIRLRRMIGPKRILLQDLAEQIGPFAGNDLKRYYVGNVKTANKLWEEIEEAKETIEIYKDADFITSTEKTNEILAVLTLVFTLTIPITVIASMYGMNVPLPGGVTSTVWTFFGRYTTFGIMVGASILFAVWMYIYFHRKKWF
jgi:magnesium transporter